MTWHSLRHLLRKKDPPPNHQFCSIQVQKPKSSQLRSYDCHADQKKNIVFIPVGPLINFLTFHQLCFRTESEIKLQNGNKMEHSTPNTSQSIICCSHTLIFLLTRQSTILYCTPSFQPHKAESLNSPNSFELQNSVSVSPDQQTQ